MASKKENQDFIEDLISSEPLDKAIDWIKDNMNPDEVYTEDQLITHIKKKCKPDEVFDDDDLAEWALENGFRKE